MTGTTWTYYNNNTILIILLQYRPGQRVRSYIYVIYIYLNRSKNCRRLVPRRWTRTRNCISRSLRVPVYIISHDFYVSLRADESRRRRRRRHIIIIIIVTRRDTRENRIGVASKSACNSCTPIGKSRRRRRCVRCGGALRV